MTGAAPQQVTIVIPRWCITGAIADIARLCRLAVAKRTAKPPLAVNRKAQ